MSYRQFRELRLRDFRCFHERQIVPLAPLTLLVGENSTGKTSFLAAVQAVWDAAHGSGDPDFRKPPFDLGSFPEIVYRRGGRRSSADSFVIGFKELVLGERLLDFDVTFESRDAAPAPVTSTWREGTVSVRRCRSDGKDARIVFESPEWQVVLPHWRQISIIRSILGECFPLRPSGCRARVGTFERHQPPPGVAGRFATRAEPGRPCRVLAPVPPVRVVSGGGSSLCERSEPPESTEDLRPHEAELGPVGSGCSFPLREPPPSGQGRLDGTQGKARCIRS